MSRDDFDDDRLTETPLSSESVFHGRLLHVQLDHARLPNGNESTREFVIHPGATAVVALLDNGKLLLGLMPQPLMELCAYAITHSLQ